MDELTNIITAFFRTSEGLKAHPCAHFESRDGWKTKSWAEVALAVKNVAANLIGLGLLKGDRVLVFSRTRLEWAIADLAVMAAGGITVPVYHSYNAEKISSIVASSRPKMAFVEDARGLQVLDRAVAIAKYTSPVLPICMDDTSSVHTVEKLSARATKDNAAKLDSTVKSISPDDVATYVYTSGTTGALKGAVITHGNIFHQIMADAQVFRFGRDDIGLLWLPLAHVLGRMIEIYSLVHGCQTAFASDMNRLPEIYSAVRPHFVCGVPRMLEKVYEGANDYVAGSCIPKRMLFKWAFSVGEKRSARKQRQKRIPFFLRIKYFIADWLVFRRLKSRLGGRLDTFICGGASLGENIARFFYAAGLMVLEGYGLTETFAAATVNRFDDFRFGTVGKPLPGVELTLATDGEIMIKGPTVFREYLNDPVETKRSFTADGWFLTGDIGEYSRDGFLRITGRKKDIIITAGGKNVAPAFVEGIMLESPYIKHFVVFGEGRRYLTGLVVLERPMVVKYLAKHGIAANVSDDLSKNPMVLSLIQNEIDSRNLKLAAFETIKRFSIVEGDFSVESGELTPTMKVRRQNVVDKYKEELERLY